MCQSPLTICSAWRGLACGFQFVTLVHLDWNQWHPLIESILPEKSEGCQAKLFDVTESVIVLLKRHPLTFEADSQRNWRKIECWVHDNGTWALKWLWKLHWYRHFICNRQSFTSRFLLWHRSKQLRQKAYASTSACNSKTQPFSSVIIYLIAQPNLVSAFESIINCNALSSIPFCTACKSNCCKTDLIFWKGFHHTVHTEK